MKNFFKKEVLPEIEKLDADTILFRTLPRMLMEVMRKYFRLEVEGIENIPKRGPVLVIPNHSGFSGFDTMMLAHEIYRSHRRIARVMTHHFWFLNETVADPAQKLGYVEATYDNGIRHLAKNDVVILFPEGEQGNFKPSHKMYVLQEFKRGFVRMAIETDCPIVPTLVIGAEETHINLSQLKFLKGAVLPIPLNLFPLPVRWKIKFLPPIYLPYNKSHLEDSELMRDIAQDVREQMQAALTAELQKRRSVWF